MSGLRAFMAENVLSADSIKLVVSERFLSNGEPIKWEIRPITSMEDEHIKKSCTSKVKAPGKKNVFIPETDYAKYLGKLAVACTVYPNLNDSTLQDSYKVMCAEELLKKMLLPGEYAEFLQRIQEINGFDITLDDEVEEVKN